MVSKRNALEQSVAKDSKKIGALSANYLGLSADVDVANESMRNQSDGLNRIKSSLALLDRDIKNNAEGIESMEAFRRQINQKIYALEQRSAVSSIHQGTSQ